VPTSNEVAGFCLIAIVEQYLVGETGWLSRWQIGRIDLQGRASKLLPVSTSVIAVSRAFLLQQIPANRHCRRGNSWRWPFNNASWLCQSLSRLEILN